MRGVEGANDILGAQSRAYQATLSGRGGIIFSLCPHRRKDEIPLANAPSSLATSP